jgi:hypothetical protein
MSSTDIACAPFTFPFGSGLTVAVSKAKLSTRSSSGTSEAERTWLQTVSLTEYWGSLDQKKG